jgi:ADP-ribosyl-[dinitrogen reductase] hydrolase
MFIGLAVGDALGAAVEFRSPGSFQPVTGYRGGTHPIPPGGWTDDTSMALALADSIAQAGWDLNDQMRRYLRWRDEGAYSVIDRCFDIGGATTGALSRFKRSGDAWSAGATDEYSAGNGSIMRLAPVPVAFAHLHPDQVELLAQRAEESSLTTHALPVCRSACAYLAVVLAALAHGESREAVLSPQWPVLERLGALDPAIESVVRGSFREKEPPAIKGSGYVVQSLEAALWAFHDAADFREAVLRAVNLGNDSDTTGAVCGQLAGAYWGESGIPQEWRDSLVRSEMIEAALAGLLPA